MNLQSRGADGLGRFKVEVPGHCDVCDTDQNVIVNYDAVSLKRSLGSIDRKRTILKNSTAVGVTCGCYAKFHRQIAHIRHKMEVRQQKRR